MSLSVRPSAGSPGLAAAAAALPPLEGPATFSGTVTVADWTNASCLKKLPPYPEALNKFLDGYCDFWPAKKRSETHIVVPLFPKVDIDGTPRLLTLRSLDRLDKAAGGTGFKSVCSEVPQDTPRKGQFRWAVMTKDGIPGSDRRDYHNQLKRLPSEYEAPSVLDAAMALLWEKQRLGIRHFNDNIFAYTHCRESVGGFQVVVGNFIPEGLQVFVSGSGGDSETGIAAFQKF